MSRASLTRYAWLSVAAAIATILLKAAAWWLTGSVGLLSDALESGVNLAGALMALSMLTIAARPADDDHAYGHSKAEYFSSGVEGTLILVAAGSIAYAAVRRMFNPQPLEQVGVGMTVSVAASLINLGVSIVLSRAGEKHNSITLRANARHLMTDVWTSFGVLVGVGAVALTGWLILDPLIALAVAANIVWSSVHILKDTIEGLMDVALPADNLRKINTVLDSYREMGIQFHALRTRRSGARKFVSVHVLVPGEWTVHQGHELAEQVEAKIRSALDGATVFTHIEPLEDPISWADIHLDREDEFDMLGACENENPGPEGSANRQA
jgi:cation diffusion facilitator family transporter